jgi:hypothetical protein
MKSQSGTKYGKSAPLAHATVEHGLRCSLQLSRFCFAYSCATQDVYCVSNVQRCKENPLQLIELVRINEAFQNHLTEQHNWCYYVTRNFLRELVLGGHCFSFHCEYALHLLGTKLIYRSAVSDE